MNRDGIDRYRGSQPGGEGDTFLVWGRGGDSQADSSWSFHRPDGPVFTIVVYRKVPTGAARLAETVRQASERFPREEWAANLATFEKRLIGSLD